ncbi:MAG: hypothetical protein H8E57_06010 [Candidatus Cloacimonetes bacterium]|nr:hypothetical protein [Candidatus Cloacimonadota bacterium]
MRKFIIFISVIFLLPFLMYSQNETQTGSELPLFLNEEFSDNTNEWLVDDDEDILIKIENGRLHYQHKKEETGYYTWNYFLLDEFEPYSIATTIHWIEGTENHGYGLLWGMEDIENYFSFEITRNGYYRITGMEFGEWKEYKGWTQSDHINSTTGINKIGIGNSGENLNFYINDNYVDQMKDEVFYDDGIGFVIWKNQTIEIENLVIHGYEFYFDYDLDFLDEIIGE